jgi:hypothetical protein
MQRISTGRLVFLALLCLAGGVMSQKGPPRLSVSQTIRNNARLMALEWKSVSGLRYAVETSKHLGAWTTLTSDLQDPTGVGNIKYPIPDAYLFDPERFFRVRIEPAK